MGLKEKAIKFAIDNAPQAIKYVALAGACTFGLLFLGIGAGGTDTSSNSSANGGYSNVGGSDILLDFIKSYENEGMAAYMRGEVSYNSSPYVYLYITEDKSQYLCGEDLRYA